jgi:hypothetical protein
VSPLSSPLHALAALALAAATLPCAAQQLRLEVVPEAALLTEQRQAAASDANSSIATSARTFSDTSTLRSNWLGSAIQIERPLSDGTGQYTKPKVRVGLPSETMRSFLNSAGLPAEKCQLPMVKAKTKLAEGDASGTLWLYARCTFR